MLCVYSLVICGVVYYAVWHNPVKDYDSIPLSGWIEHRGENKDIATTNDIDFLVQKLGFVDEGVTTGKIEICEWYLGYVYSPADSAYGRLLELSLPYDETYRYYEESIHGNNRLRSILLARLLCRKDPARFSSDTKKLLKITHRENKKVLICQGIIEAFIPKMLMHGTSLKKSDEAYDAFFAEGSKLFNITDLSQETTNVVWQEMSKVVVPLSKQRYHGKMIVYDTLYFRMLLCEEYVSYTYAMKKRK